MSEEGKQAALAIAEQMRLKDERIAELEAALREVSNKFHRCLVQNGTDREWAALAVGTYDEILARTLAKAGPR